MLSDAPAVAIVGPTGARKSYLALRVAREFHGEIVNCDSLQLYQGFNIGTAKLPQTTREDVPHHLFDVLQPHQGYSAGDYARDARAAIARISACRRMPIITGGTGFYWRALLRGLPSLPPRDESIRVRLTLREQRRPGTLHRILSRLDPAASARIHARDVQKLTRALEIRLLTRNPLPPPDVAEPLRGYRVLQIGLNPDRQQLYDALDARVRRMFAPVGSALQSGDAGLVEEVESLLAHGCSGSEKPFGSLGYKQALEYVRGAATLEQAIASTQLETRQYAKRQLTWFRRDPDVHWLEGFGDSPAVIDQCLDLVARLTNRA
jgi:tRNA dimethylallyltransferase